MNSVRILSHLPIVYVVRYGDTLGGVAKIYGVSQARIKQANNLNGEMLEVGRMLAIPLDKQ